MPIEVRGKRVRIRIRSPIKGAKYGTHDVGEKGHSERISMINPKTGKWVTQSWSFPIKDVIERRPKTIKILKRLGVKRKVMDII